MSPAEIMWNENNSPAESYIWSAINERPNKLITSNQSLIDGITPVAADSPIPSPLPALYLHRISSIILFKH
ncbi:hypothetical protein L1887_29511 [Cichorium endivia]|nr:hypothetical protein L1887_29511 [Cichorium endivia]